MGHREYKFSWYWRVVNNVMLCAKRPDTHHHIEFQNYLRIKC